MVSEFDLDIQDKLWKVRCQLITLSFWDIYWSIWEMDARGQRALARRNRREVSAVVQEGPREEEIVESDIEEEESFEK